MTSFRSTAWWAMGSAWLSAAALAQPAEPPSSGTGAAKPAGGAAHQTVEISAGPQSDTEERRQSTAAKIVIGREEIDRFGDSSLGDVLRRLPGITMSGPPGSGGAPRMRGLGSGYTRLLIDGQRAPRGFSLDQLSPEQVERIEILRAPTAETGARAIAGTINIITREGFGRRQNNLRAGAGVVGGEVSPDLRWTYNDSAGPLIYNLSASVSRRVRVRDSVTDSLREDAESGEALRVQRETQDSRDIQQGVSLTSRLQWRLGENGDVLVLTPTLFQTDGRTARTFDLAQPLSVQNEPTLYDRRTSDSDTRSRSLRLNAQWRQLLSSGTRFQLGGVIGRWESFNDTDRIDFRDEVAEPLRTRQDLTRAAEHMLGMTAKWSQLLGGSDDEPGGEHSLVGGMEIEGVRRHEKRSTLVTGTGGGFSDEFDAADSLQATSVRVAGYVQDEWQLSPRWAAHAGLRWEGIATRGTADDGSRPQNVSRVLTPLLHALWKPDPRSRDQLRVSLTRSYRSPPLASLIAQRTTSSRFPVDGPNERLYPDRIGNPDLKPELATGIDLAIERYLAGGGVLSANVFHRRIDNLIREEVTLQTVDWSVAPRWVSRPGNIGGATSQGLELEAKFRLDHVMRDAPRVELRNNLSLYRSRVDGVPSPDNRLDGQAKAAGNFGVDYRLRTLPMAMGASLNWIPAYRVQRSAEQAVSFSTRRVFDAYALWTFSPTVAVRATAGNLSPRTNVTTNVADSIDTSGRAIRDTSVGASPSDVYWQLRLELKL